MAKPYQPQNFEQKWIDAWEKEQTYKAAEPKNNDKMYVLDMFPYPSGAGLHVGHPRGYTATDIIARYFRMMGKDVLHPMGWDAFGLPAENAAIKNKQNPIDIVPLNIANFKRQMKMLGLGFDWSREFATTDPKYYGLTQMLFMQFYRLGLLYKKNTPVYFCPFCKTGLAEEEVLPDGTHERCQKPIERRELPQWIFRITTYADSLLDGLKDLQWPTGILEMQRNWIGKKEGINITYKIVDIEGEETITCFTTRPDTNFGATFVVLAPEHPFVKKILNGKIHPSHETNVAAIRTYVETTLSKTDVERMSEGKKKTGVFTGFYVKNELNARRLPVWISDFVLSNFGTGAVVGVPAHDMRDFEFAIKFDIPIVRVVQDKDGDESPITKPEQVQEEEGKMINSEFLNGMEINAATKAMMDHMEKMGMGKRVVSYHLRDWIFSRQRYWGEPIPMVYCPKCAKDHISEWDTKEGKAFHKANHSISKLDKDTQKNMEGWFTISEQSLPLELPYLKSYEPSGTGESPLANVPDWVKTTCPNCGGPATRETDTMPNWAGSCWYFLAFAFWDKNEAKPTFDTEKIQKWNPVDYYFGGAEHAVLHLLYARFWMHVLNDMGWINFREPFMKLRNVGMILAEDHRKMSKSWGNVINPDDVVKEYGADALRMYEMFMAPFSQEISWSTASLQGVYRFLKRVWSMYEDNKGIANEDAEADSNVSAKLQKTIVKVGKDIADVKFNTAIASMMEFLNEWENKKVSMSDGRKFIQILAPFAPFMTEEIWRTVLGEKGSIHRSKWPVAGKITADVDMEIPVQINGRYRATISVPVSATEDTIVKKALEDENVKKFVTSKPKKVIYVPGKILNIIA